MVIRKKLSQKIIIELNLHNHLSHVSVSKINHNHMCRLIRKTVENNDPVPSSNFEHPVYVAEEEEFDEIPEEVSRLLEREENTIQPYKVPLEVINLGFVDDVKEIKIGALLHPE